MRENCEICGGVLFLVGYTHRTDKNGLLVPVHSICNDHMNAQRGKHDAYDKGCPRCQENWKRRQRAALRGNWK